MTCIERSVVVETFKPYNRRMELAFATKCLRHLCESEVRAERRLGVLGARALQRRLAEIVAAESVEDLVAGQPRFIRENPHEQLVLRVGDNFEVVLKVNHNSVPMLESGTVDWAQVTRVQVLSIKEVHRA